MKKKWHLLVRFIKSNRLLVAVTFFSGLLYNIFTLLIPISLGRFYDFNFGFTSYRLKLLEFVPFINSKSFTGFLIFFVVLVMLRFIFEYTNKYLISINGEGFAKNLREQLFEHQLQINSSVYDEKGIGKYLLRYSGDLKSIQNYISKGIFRFSQDLVLIVLLLITIAYIDPFLGVLLSLSIASSGVVLFFLNNVLYSISVNQRNQRSGLLTFINTRLRAISSVKAFNKYSIEQKRYVKRSENLFETSKKYQRVAGLIQSIIPGLTYLMLALLMGYIFYEKTKNDTAFDQSVVLILILLIVSFLPILRRTLRVTIIWKLGNISFKKLINILRLDTENSISSKKIGLANKVISLSNVSFKYSTSGKGVFEKLTVRLLPERSTIITGTSGSGKSTMINLLLKMYQPVDGNISYGKHNQKTISEKTIRRNFAVVSDNYPLYGKTVYEAITYSRNNGSRQKASKLLATLQQFENDRNQLELDNKIGDIGQALTAGQKRILMYCRALLTNKPWLIIDQPYKDLNPGTVDYIKNKLNLLHGKKGLLIFDTSIPHELKIDHAYKMQNNALAEN